MIECRRLKNNISVVIEQVKGVRSVAIGVYVKVGSSYETVENNGISHMLEHMMFKGTSNHSARELAVELAKIGDDMNAYTAKELTCYYGRVLDQHVEQILRLLGDMLTNSLFEEEELEKEKGIILDEIDMYEDSPEDLVQEQWQKQVWKEHPLGYIISGPQENVRRIGRQELVDFWKQYYCGNNMVISVSGNVDIDELYNMVERYFGDIPSGEEKEIVSAPIYVPGNHFIAKDTEQYHLCMGYPGVSHTAQDTYVMSVVNGILGGSSCSRLFQQIREDLGMCYNIYSYGTSYRNTGAFQIYAAMSQENYEAVYHNIIQVVEDLRKYGPTKEELQLTISQITAELYLAMENTHNRMNNNARHILYWGRVLSPEEILKRVGMVGPQEIKDYVVNYMQPDQLSITLLGDKFLSVLSDRQFVRDN